MKALIDTCVVLDLVLERKGFDKEALGIAKLIQNKRIRGLITVKSLMDIHYVVKNVLNDEEKTRDILKDILILFELVGSKTSEALSAFYTRIKDYEDSLMYETAKTQEVDCIITRNIKDFKNIDIDIKTPKQVLSDLEQ